MADPAILTTLASPRRREILRLVWKEELTAGAIHRAMPDVTFGAVSLQLRGLFDACLVELRAEKQNRFYRAKREALGELADVTLIDKNDGFMFGFSKLDVMFGHADATSVHMPYAKFVNASTFIVQSA